VLGWFLARRSESRKEQSEHYRLALLDVRKSLEDFLEMLRREDYTAYYKAYDDYLRVLSRVEPYKKRVGKHNFEFLENLREEHLDDYRNISNAGEAISIINKLLAE
jgi:hypothetical protein